MAKTTTKGTGRQKVTLLTLADATGVSKSSISRILNAPPSAADNDIARRVRRTAAKLGYVRNTAAAQLRLGRSMTIGVVVTHLTDAVMAMFYEAVASLCAASGRFAFAASTGDAPGADRAAVETLLKRGVDGLILTTTRLDDDLARQMALRGVPFVLALRTDGHSPSAVGDDELGGYLAAKHLIDLGHRRIAMIAGSANASSSSGRLAGFYRAMNEAGLQMDPALMAPSRFGFESGAQAARDLMAVAPPPTAIFAINDGTAIGALSALTAMGYGVPQDVSLVGYSDIPIAQHLPVPLTTVHVPFAAIAADALELLAATADEAGSAMRVTAPQLIVRGSTAPPKA